MLYLSRGMATHLFIDSKQQYAPMKVFTVFIILCLMCERS